MQRRDFPDFTELLAQLRSLDPSIGATSANVGSGQSVFHKKHLPLKIKNGKGGEVRELSVAVLKPKGNAQTRKMVTEKNSQIFEKIRQKYKKLKKKPSPFLQSVLAHGGWGRVTQLETDDLSGLFAIDGIKLTTTKKRNCKEIVAQLVLAIYEFHEILNLVHRDIKPENILVTLLPDGRVYLQLTDFELGGVPDQKNLGLGTAEYSDAPEIRDLVEDVKLSWSDRIIGKKWKDHHTENQMKEFNAADKKALDCYALGKVIEKIWNNYKFSSFPIETNNDYMEMKALFESLKKPKEERLSIKEVMNHPLFGANKKECAAYFEQVKKDFERPEIYVDHFYNDEFSPEKNNAFLLLPAPLKHVYLAAEGLNNNVSIAEAKQEPLIYTVMYKKAKNLLYQIDRLSPSLKTKETAPIIKGLIQKAKEVMNIVYKNAHQQIDQLEENNIKKVTTKQLKDAVERAHKRYKKLNDLESKSVWAKFWSSHGEVGQRNAGDFKDQIQNLAAHYAREDVYEAISDHLRSGPGKWAPASFKTLLAKELGAISSLPFDRWDKIILKYRGTSYRSSDFIKAK